MLTAKFAGCALTAVLLLGSRPLQAAPTIEIRIYDRVGVPAGTLIKAEKVAERIFDDAGVVIRWARCSEKLHLPCQGAPRPGQYVLTIEQERQQGQRENVLGVAVGGYGARRIYLHSYYQDVLRVARDNSLSPGVVLGTVVAHEIGHLLLGPDSHSAGGVMQPKWSPQLLRLAEKGTVRFAPDEAESIRAEINSINNRVSATEY